MARGVSSSTIPASAGKAQAGGRGLGRDTGSWPDGVSGCIWLGLGGKMGSFSILRFGEPKGGGGLGWDADCWMDESFMPAPL